MKIYGSTNKVWLSWLYFDITAFSRGQYESKHKVVVALCWAFLTRWPVDLRSKTHLLTVLILSFSY